MKSKDTKNHRPTKGHKLIETILVTASKVDGISPGKYYNLFSKKDKSYIFNENAEKVFLDSEQIKWKALDTVVMIIQVKSSLLNTLQPEGIYRVFDDTANDERYIFDDNREKVLFDENIFTWEVV